MAAERAVRKYAGHALVAAASACAGLVVGLAIDGGQADPPAPPAVVTPREIVASESRRRPGRAEVASAPQAPTTPPPAIPPLPRLSRDDVRVSKYFHSESEDSKGLPPVASASLLREMAFRQAADDLRWWDLSPDKRGPAAPALDFYNFLSDPQFACLLRYVLFADLATKRRGLAGTVRIGLRTRRHLGLIDPLLRLGHADESARDYCVDYIQSNFPEMGAILRMKGVGWKQEHSSRRSLSFWQEWWDDNRHRYMRRGDSQDKIIAALKHLACSYEDALLASAPVAQVRSELGLDNVPWEGVTQLIERGHGAQAAALLGYLWAQHQDKYLFTRNALLREVDSRVLSALTVATHPSNTAVVARLDFQWSVSRHGIDYIPESLVTLVRDGVNDQIREAAANLMIAQADRHVPSYTPMLRTLKLWESAQDDPIVRRACSDTIAAFLPAPLPEQPQDTTLEYWKRLLIDGHYLASFFGNTEGGGIRLQTQPGKVIDQAAEEVKLRTEEDRARTERARRTADEYGRETEEARRSQQEAGRKAGIPVASTLDCGGGVTMDLVLIPAGEFMMGSPASEAQRGSDEGPQHRVRITQAFYMGKCEVTQSQYERVMGTNPSRFKGADNPVETVSWNDATEFCRKLSQRAGKQVRLPTEAEWEYACRAGTTTPFHYGNSLGSSQANFNGNRPYGGAAKGTCSKKTTSVGSFAANAWGLHDMHGNLMEWCADWYDKGYYGKNPGQDPTGPASGDSRVYRGGSWFVHGHLCRSADRYRGGPTNHSGNIGFRVVALASPGR